MSETASPTEYIVKSIGQGRAYTKQRLYSPHVTITGVDDTYCLSLSYMFEEEFTYNSNYTSILHGLDMVTVGIFNRGTVTNLHERTNLGIDGGGGIWHTIAYQFRSQPPFNV
jgi:hypothetical protein